MSRTIKGRTGNNLSATETISSIREATPIFSFVFQCCICLGVVAVIVMLGVHMAQDTAVATMIMKQAYGNKMEVLQGQASVVNQVLSGAAAKPISTSPPPPPPSSTTPPPVLDCDVAIIGAGPGGLTMAYRLAPIYGSRLCIFDERDHVGGKVHSQRYTASSATKPVWTPTHAEQYRGGDTILRCMSQEVGTIQVVRGTPGLMYDYFALGINATGFQCFGNVTPTGGAACPAGNPWEGVLAPNGFTGSSPYGTLLNPCASKDWKTCSYTDEYQKILLSISNTNTIQTTETFIQYTTRILGAPGAKYYSDQYGLAYMDELDARAMTDYLAYDNLFPYGHVHMPHGAPQVGTWNRVANLIVGNASRIMLNTKIQSIDKVVTTSTGGGDGGYTLYSAGDSPMRVNAKKVVLAFPPNHLSTMTGSIANTLKVSPFVTYSKPTHACTWNAFFPTRWWKKHSATCNFGYCAIAKSFNLTNYARENYMGWNYGDSSGAATSIDFIQYVPTPERNESNLLRYFFEEAPCKVLDAIYAASGAAGIQTELMYRTRFNFGSVVDQPIPTPVESYYSSEPYGYAGIAPGAPFRATDWLQWAVEPLVGENLCIATEGVNMFDSGWQEAAAKVAHNCLRGNLFKDVIRSTDIDALERCRANITSNANRYLDSGNKNSGNDVCLLLKNEYHIRDLANYTYCGSPKVYDYPNLTSFTSNSYAPNPALWSNAVTIDVYETSMSFRNRRHGI